MTGIIGVTYKNECKCIQGKELKVKNATILRIIKIMVDKTPPFQYIIYGGLYMIKMIYTDKYFQRLVVLLLVLILLKLLNKQNQTIIALEKQHQDIVAIHLKDQQILRAVEAWLLAYSETGNRKIEEGKIR